MTTTEFYGCNNIQKLLSFIDFVTQIVQMSLNLTVFFLKINIWIMFVEHTASPNHQTTRLAKYLYKNTFLGTWEGFSDNHKIDVFILRRF